MHRIAVGAIVAAAAAAGFALAACSEDASDTAVLWTPRADCRRYAACGTCTPVLGCGWCSVGGGNGTCVANPDECGSAPFSFTWDPSGCRVLAEAGVLGPQGSVNDGGAPAADGHALTPDAATGDPSSKDGASESGTDASRADSSDAHAN